MTDQRISELPAAVRSSLPRQAQEINKLAFNNAGEEST